MPTTKTCLGVSSFDDARLYCPPTILPCSPTRLYLGVETFKIVDVRAALWQHRSL